MKKIAIALVAGVITFSGIYGLAASLNLNTDSLGASTTTVAACQAGALTASYTVTYSASTPGYTTGTVSVSGLASTCYSKAYKVTLSTTANASLGEVVGTTPSSGTSFAANFSPAVNAASVTGISIVISG